MPSEETSSMSAAECSVAASRLESLAAELRQVEELGVDELWVFRKRSLDLSLERAGSFQQELRKSIQAVQIGKPFGPETEKGRNPTRRKAPPQPSADDQMIDDVDKELAAEARKRAAKRKAAKKKSPGRKSNGSGG